MPPLERQHSRLLLEGTIVPNASASATPRPTPSEGSTSCHRKQGAPRLATHQRCLLRQQRRQENEKMHTKESLRRRWCVLQKYRECLEEGLRVLEEKADASRNADHEPSSKDQSGNSSSTRHSRIHCGDTSVDATSQASESHGGVPAPLKNSRPQVKSEVEVISPPCKRVSGESPGEREASEVLSNSTPPNGVKNHGECTANSALQGHPQGHLMRILSDVAEQCSALAFPNRLQLTKRKSATSRRRRWSTGSDIRLQPQEPFAANVCFSPALGSGQSSALEPLLSAGDPASNTVTAPEQGSSGRRLRTVRFRSPVASPSPSCLPLPSTSSSEPSRANGDADDDQVQKAAAGCAAETRLFEETWRRSALRCAGPEADALTVRPPSLPREARERVNFFLAPKLSSETEPLSAPPTSAVQEPSPQANGHLHRLQPDIALDLFSLLIHGGVRPVPPLLYLGEQALAPWQPSVANIFAKEWRLQFAENHLPLAIPQNGQAFREQATSLQEPLFPTGRKRAEFPPAAPFYIQELRGRAICFLHHIAVTRPTNMQCCDHVLPLTHLEKQQSIEEVQRLRRLLGMKNRTIKLLSGQGRRGSPSYVQQGENELLQEHIDRHDLLGTQEKQRRYEGWQRLCLRSVRQPTPPGAQGEMQHNHSSDHVPRTSHSGEYVDSIIHRFANVVGQIEQRRLVVDQLLPTENTELPHGPLQVQCSQFTNPQLQQTVFFQGSSGVLIASDSQTVQDLPFLQGHAHSRAVFSGASRGVMRNDDSSTGTHEGAAGSFVNHQTPPQPAQHPSQEQRRSVLFLSADLENAVSRASEELSTPATPPGRTSLQSQPTVHFSNSQLTLDSHAADAPSGQTLGVYGDLLQEPAYPASVVTIRDGHYGFWSNGTGTGGSRELCNDHP